MKKETYCEICGTKTKHGGKTCSRICSDELKKINNREKRNCVFCKSEFTVKKTSKTKLCSPECRKKWAALPENKEKRIKASIDAQKEKYNGETFIETSQFKLLSKQTKKERYDDENFVNSKKAKQTKKERYDNDTFNNTEKSKQTKKERYNDENYNNRSKAKETSNMIFGQDHAMKLKKFQKKAQNSLQKNHGVKFPLQSQFIKEKQKNTVKERYNVDFISQIPEVKEKIKILFNERFDSTKIFISLKNSNLTLLNDYIGIRTKIDNKTNYTLYNFKCNKCENEFQGTFSNHRAPICRTCYPSYKNSNISLLIKQFLTDNHIKFSENARNVITPLELDFYIPEHNFAIEVNGNYWHSEIGGNKDKNYHLNKTKLCNEKGIKLIHIFEDELMFKKDIVQSRLLNELNKTKETIYARKCEIKKVTNFDKQVFLDENHLMGNSKDSIRIGLFYETKLVSLMTFSKRRIALGVNTKKEKAKGDWELNRFCSKINTNVVGAFPRLLKNFTRTYEPSLITTYADIRWSGILPENTVYNKSFTFIHQAPPSHWYFRKGDYLKRYHRFTFNKGKLLALSNHDYKNNMTGWEIAQSLKMDRIWDCGTLKFILKKKAVK